MMNTGCPKIRGTLIGPMSTYVRKYIMRKIIIKKILYLSRFEDMRAQKVQL
jgi:hypothetical protein